MRSDECNAIEDPTRLSLLYFYFFRASRPGVYLEAGESAPGEDALVHHGDEEGGHPVEDGGQEAGQQAVLGKGVLLLLLLLLPLLLLLAGAITWKCTVDGRLKREAP